MKTFRCACGQLVFFEDVTCGKCGRELGFFPDILLLSDLEQSEAGLFGAPKAGAASKFYRKCQNYSKESVCNWMIPLENSAATDNEPFCASCRLNRTIPDLSVPRNHAIWALIETAKRRMLYTLLQWKLPIASKPEDPNQGLAFAFLSDVTNPDGSVSRVLTGHADGLITMNIAEADDATREKIRLEMHEPYRTLLGDFRHEIGHYYWYRLVRGTKYLDRSRELFGDEQANYGNALKRYYSSGPLPNWRDNYISAYATSHPWEDWAATWAHFMLIQDVLEVAGDFGIQGKTILLDPKKSGSKPWLSSPQTTMEGIVRAWSELATALTSINRSLGLHDSYASAMPIPVLKKLAFIFEVIFEGAHTGPPKPEK